MIFNRHQSLKCDMVLYDPDTNEVQPKGGVNWGHGSGHVSTGDGYVPIRAQHIREFPNLFPPKQTISTTTVGGRSDRENDSINMIWDDGETMVGLFEGSQTIDGIVYPKNLGSFPGKHVMGSYIRRRLGLIPNILIKKSHLDNYGRNYISVSLLEDGTYYMDFSI